MCCCPCDVLAFTGSLALGLHASAYLPRAVCALVGFLAHMFACCAGEHVSIACVCSCGAQVEQTRTEWRSWSITHYAVLVLRISRLHN